MPSYKILGEIIKNIVDKIHRLYYCINRIVQQYRERKDVMAWSLDADRPIYTQIVERIEMQIVSGSYKPGDKVPSVRDLAADAGVNPNTMQRALAELERKGLVTTQRTSGRVVTEDMKMIREVRNTLAKEQIQDFMLKMKELGFEREEIVALLKKEAGGECV